MRSALAVSTIAAAGMLVAFALVIGSLAAPAESAPVAAVRLADLVGNPSGYDARTIAVTGAWAPGPRLRRRDASKALLLRAGARQLVVIPALGVAVPHLGRRAEIRATGRLELVGASGHGPIADFLRRRHLLPEGDAARPVLVADGIARVPAPLSRSHVARRVEIGRILRHAGEFDRSAVTVTGRLTRLGDGVFRLASHGNGIVLAAGESTQLAGAAGHRVRLRARVQRLSPVAAAELPDGGIGDPYLLSVEVLPRR